MSQATILVADDDHGIRTVVDQALSRAGYRVRTAANAATLWRWVSDGEGDLVITDVIMPDENGLEMIPRIRKARPNLKVIVMSAQNTLMTAVKATERGAFDYLPKPFDLNELVAVAGRALAARSGAEGLQADAPGDAEQSPLVGRSASMQEIYRTLARLVGNDLTVMINGESGTGKELAARALHELGKRRNRPFVAVNMAAIPEDLIESELFGHEKGAFTGATSRSSGKFEQAEGGTLFLDEIGDMPMEAQTRLLRVLQENEYTTVGGHTPISTDVRIVAATHRDLTEMIRVGRFREDLYYRLNVVPIRIPPLRDRLEDIPELMRHFMNVAEEDGLPIKVFDPDAIARLQAYRWPGNVRELENMIQRILVLYSEETITGSIIDMELAGNSAVSGQPAAEVPVGSGSLSDSVRSHIDAYFDAHDGQLPPPGLYVRVLRELERPLLERTLQATRGNQVKASELLGVNRNTLRKKIKELNINVRRGQAVVGDEAAEVSDQAATDAE